MTKSAAMHRIAAEDGITVILLDLPETGSMCIQADDQCCYIGMDRHIPDKESTHCVHMAHELGHCITGAFYNRWAACDIRQKHENRADRWAIEQLVPVDELNRAVAAGHTEIWSLAEYFNVSDDFMRKAVCLYTHGNLASELYF